MPLTPMAEARISAECEDDANNIVQALREIDELEGRAQPEESYDRPRILRALRKSRGLDA